MLRTPTIYTMPTFIDQFQIRLLICKFCGVAIQSISCSVLTCLTMSKHRLYTFPKALKHQSKQPVITWKLQSIEASKIVQIHQSWKTIAIYGNYDIFKKYFQMCSFIWWNNLINMSMGCGAMIKSKIAKFSFLTVYAIWHFLLLTTEEARFKAVYHTSYFLWKAYSQARLRWA